LVVIVIVNKITKKGCKSVQNWVINEQSKVIEDKGKIATIFNSVFVDSVQCLVKNFGPRPRVLQLANTDFPVFTIKNVSENTVMKTLDCLKGSKSKDVFDFDAKFFLKKLQVNTM